MIKAKRKTPSKKRIIRCGYCRLAKPINETWNISLAGHAIAARCPYSDVGILKGDVACEHFEKSKFEGDIWKVDGFPVLEDGNNA
ncbi:MAG: hypothetical protein K5854_09540 [Prevotella sp.]|nr:hypothetical protein [Prevotella sp.]